MVSERKGMEGMVCLWCMVRYGNGACSVWCLNAKIWKVATVNVRHGI